jgi:hypothetical protein
MPTMTITASEIATLLSSLYYCPLCHQEIGLGVGWIATFLHRPKMMISFPLHVQRLGA